MYIYYVYPLCYVERLRCLADGKSLRAGSSELVSIDYCVRWGLFRHQGCGNSGGVKDVMVAAEGMVQTLQRGAVGTFGNGEV